VNRGLAGCLGTGAVMLAVAAGATWTSPPGDAASRGTLVLVLLVGALAVVGAALRPGVAALAGLAVLCVVLALVAEPVEPVDAGVAGLACLGFLLAVRLRRQARSAPVDLGEWLAGHRPMAVGAAVTTSAAVAAASAPAGWSPLVTALVGLACGAACALLCRAVFR
jgi:hypothetical protein